MPIIGSDGGFQADNRGGIIDELGNTVVSADTSFAASPLGVAARTQALYGIPNANFNITPPEPDSPIVANQNDLPYWSIEELSDGVMTATTIFDSTTQTWGVEIDPGTAASGSTLTLSTRSYLITDDNLALRQKALAVLAKSGTAAGTTEWRLVLDAVYYDANDSALSTAIIGTALDTGTWTSLAGTTTPGGSAINAAAQYVDLTFTMTATADVTGSAKATIKSLILATSTPGGGGSQSFLVTETFTANDTWTRPTGVNYLVAVVAAGGGGGGRGGIARSISGTTNSEPGQGGGSGAGFYIVRDLYVGDQSTVSVGIGAGGAGGASANLTKAGGVTTSPITIGPNNGSDGGATTFGSYFSVDGGNGGTARQGAPAPSSATTSVYGGANVLGGVGGTGSNGTADGGDGAAGGFGTLTIIPYSVVSATGATGGSASITGGTVTVSAPGSGGTGWIGGGGGGGNSGASAASSITASGNGRNGGGGAGGQAAVWVSASSTSVSGTAGAGGDGVNGAGGGAGGNVVLAASSVSNYNSSILNYNSGKGGDGGNGWLTVVYVA